MKRMALFIILAGIAIIFSIGGYAQDILSYQWKNVTICGGGFVPGIIFSPVQPDLIFARTDMAGAYRWNEKKSEWNPVTDWMGREDNRYFGIESIAPDPRDPDIVYMAAGTYLNSGNGIILKSTDRGITWTKHAINVPMGANHDGRSMGERLAVDPENTDVIYFGSRQDGLLKSSDAGQTWEPVNKFNVKGIKGLGLSFVYFYKNTESLSEGSSVIFIGVADTSAGSNLYHSPDAGFTWHIVDGGPSGLMPHHMAEAADGNIYITYNNRPGPNGISYGEVWKYRPGDDQWQNVSPPQNGGGFGGISCSKKNAQFILVTTIDRWRSSDEIYRTVDGGKTWEIVGSVAVRDIQGVNYLYWHRDRTEKKNLSSMGWMGDIDIDPFNPDRAFYVTGQGIWLSNNINESPDKVLWRFETRGLEETVALDLTSSVNGALFSAVGDLGGFRHTRDSLDIPSESGMYNNPVFANCDGIDYAGLNPFFVVRCGTSRAGNGAWSVDNGMSWVPFQNQPGSGGGRIALAADGSTIIWSQWSYRSPHQNAHRTDTIVRSTDRGMTWSPCYGVSGRIRITADRKNPDKFYALKDKTLYMSTDRGYSFIPVQSGIEAEGYNQRVNAVFDRDGDIWITGGDKLYHSINSGKEVSTIEQVEKVKTIGFGKAAPGMEYPAVYLVGIVNGVYGVFRSTDMARSWIRINDDQHQFGSMDYIAGDEQIFGRVYIGTHGRGIVYGDPDSH